MSRKVKEDILPIEDSPSNVVKSMMKGKPKKQWRYLKRVEERKTKRKTS
ncbi:MAG: hypothetical protein OXG24_04510 [Gammaproteobacteria bacterium]|nr:hypothetical protein [Gammaproteobacteria bacterium]